MKWSPAMISVNEETGRGDDLPCHLYTRYMVLGTLFIFSTK